MNRKNFSTSDGVVEMLILGDPNSEEKVLIMAGKHGDEPEGVYIIKNFLIPYLEENEFFNKCFVIFPNLNPNKVNACLDKLVKKEIKKYEMLREFRFTESGVNLNADYPTVYREEDDAFLQATQTSIVIDAVNGYGCGLILDFHTNGPSYMSLYKYDEKIGKALAEEMGKITKTASRDYVHHKNKGKILSGTSGTYFGRERKIPIITIELGRAKPQYDFFRHCERLWKRHKPGLDYLFASFPDPDDDDIQDGCGENGVSAS
ncbi:MAG: succinylglutamate desuccinylase/aspartoacylase family protein [Lactobacillus sp.]|jgi:predicted deacylase|nr:succinylglutamate desuccinylase/aspartoacylase family protein [Lactobacillus sp.]